MSRIQVNIEQSRRENARLSPIRNNVDEVRSRLRHIQSGIDSRVLDRRDLRTRLVNVRNRIDLVENDLQDIQTCIRDILNRYEEADRDLLSEISSVR